MSVSLKIQPAGHPKIIEKRKSQTSIGIYMEYCEKCITSCINGDAYGYCDSDYCDGFCVHLGACECECHEGE